MQIRVIAKLIGVLLILFSISMLPPLLVALVYHENTLRAFGSSYLITLLTGLVIWGLNRSTERELRLRDGFMVVVLFWTVLAGFGALPFYLSHLNISPSDSLFESMSGLTTTGATVLSGLDALPRSLLYYRQQLQWLGGMGIIVLAVAVMPMLGIGGMQLFRAETPGPMKDTKLTPRITETAKALWFIYLGLTVACALSYWVAGMSPFDAIGHSFSTVAIGGFSTHDLSLGYFQNPAVELVAIVFMLIAVVNFALHFTAWRSRQWRIYGQDDETITFFRILMVAAIVVLLVLISRQVFDTPYQALREGIFQLVSIATTTGFTTGGYHWWPVFLPLFLLVLSSVGGCAGSTAGGIKVIRVLLLYKQGRREILRLIHPRALSGLKVNRKPVPDNVINAVWAFFSLYILCLMVLSLAVSATGVDWLTAFSSVLACLNNLGPGLGDVAGTYASLTPAAKWLLSFTMLLGRLELFTLLVLFSATFWRS